MDDVNQIIRDVCMNTKSKDPFEILFEIMGKDCIKMHGPIHHIVDGSSFLAAMHNAGVDFDLSKALDEMVVRGEKMPGATCGQWGMCGSASSIGAALAIIHGTGPLSDSELYKDNMRYVSKAIAAIGEVGGPRCCKRNAFLSMTAAVDFVKERYGIELGSHKVTCIFKQNNPNCIGTRCPFYEK